MVALHCLQSPHHHRRRQNRQRLAQRKWDHVASSHHSLSCKYWSRIAMISIVKEINVRQHENTEFIEDKYKSGYNAKVIYDQLSQITRKMSKQTPSKRKRCRKQQHQLPFYHHQPRTLDTAESSSALIQTRMLEHIVVSLSPTRSPTKAIIMLDRRQKVYQRRHRRRRRRSQSTIQ